MTMPVRAALYLRVSTGRQAENDLSIPDQRRQAKGYCASRGWEIVADYVEPGLSATDDRRPEFQRMIDAATTKPPAFDVILVHSFSRFFRDQFQLEFYVRRLALLTAIEYGGQDFLETNWLQQAPLDVIGNKCVELLHRHRAAHAPGLTLAGLGGTSVVPVPAALAGPQRHRLAARRLGIWKTARA